MALLNPTFLFGICVLAYLSTFVVFAVLRILTGVSIQRVGYFSLRRLAYTPRDGIKIEIRGLGLNVHRPTFSQPTWLSIVVTELAVTVDLALLGRPTHDRNGGPLSDVSGNVTPGTATPPMPPMPPPPGQHHQHDESAPGPAGPTPALNRSRTWDRIMEIKDRAKALHKNLSWIRLVDVVANNSTLAVADVGTIQIGTMTLAVDTRRRMVDRARFFFSTIRRRGGGAAAAAAAAASASASADDAAAAGHSTGPKRKRQAEWIMTLRSVLLTTEGREPLEVLDNASLNVHGFLHPDIDGLLDASVSLKFGRVHVPYDDVATCLHRYGQRPRTRIRRGSSSSDISRHTSQEPVDIILRRSLTDGDMATAAGGGGAGGGGASARADLAQTVSESKEFVASILRGVKEVQFAVSFVGLTKKLESVAGGGGPILLTASMKEVGVDLHRLDPKSPAHRMYFPATDIAHEALAAALSISVGLDEGQGKPERLVYVPMATTTVRTTLPAKTVELWPEGSAEERNQNILVANSVITSPSVDLDPRHLSLLVALLRARPSPPWPPPPPTQQHHHHHQQRHQLISRLLPKASIKFSMHEPVLRIALPPVERKKREERGEKTADDPDDDFDLIIASISSVSLDVESFHSAVEHVHYSLSSVMRVQTSHLYYQTASGTRFDLFLADAFDLKVQTQANPDLHVLATGNLQACSIRLVRPEIAEGLQQIVRQLRREAVAVVVPRQKPAAPSQSGSRPNLLRTMPPWLLHVAIHMSDLSVEVAGVDEPISAAPRGVAVQLDALSVEYSAHASSGIVRRRTRQRSTSRSIVPDADFPKVPPPPPTTATTTTTAPPSPLPGQKKPSLPYLTNADAQTGSERRLSILSKGLEIFLIEAADRTESDPFVTMPRLEVVLSTMRDRHGPIFDVRIAVKTLLIQYSLYRHYAIGVAARVLQDAFLQSSRDRAPGAAAAADDISPTPPKPEPTFLSPYPIPEPARTSAGPTAAAAGAGAAAAGAGAAATADTTMPELMAIDFRAALIQIKADLPADPPLMLHICRIEAGRRRWSPPHLSAQLIRLYVETPRARGIWARMVSVRMARLDLRQMRRKPTSGGPVDEKSIDLEAEAVRIAVPHEVIVSQITDNCINTFKAVQQLHHRWLTGTDEYVLEKSPEGPKPVPKMSVRTRALLFEIEDGAFEWKLGMIYRAGLIEQEQRLAREQAFEVKLKKMRDEEASRKESNTNNRFRGRSLFTAAAAAAAAFGRGRGPAGDSAATPDFRSRSADPAPGRRSSRDSSSRGSSSSSGYGHDRYRDDEDDNETGRPFRGRRPPPPRYDPNAAAQGLTGLAKRSPKEARYKLDVYNSQSWRRRIDQYCADSQRATRESRAAFWGADGLLDDSADQYGGAVAERILEVPDRPALMSTLVLDLRVSVDKPTFPLRDLPEFLRRVGKGMPKDMQYSLLVPMHLQIEMAEARVLLRDYPLPLFHVPGLGPAQPPRSKPLVLAADFVVAEEFRAVESKRRIGINIVPAAPDGSGGFTIQVGRTIGPVKSFSDVTVDINSVLPTRMTWGPAYQPCIQDMMMAIESFTKPQIDPSELVGFWDKLRLNVHSRIRVAWRGDGEMHLALKGSRDPYSISGPGAGFLMCWRDGVAWDINPAAAEGGGAEKGAEKGDHGQAKNPPPPRFMTVVTSGEYVLAVPDYGAQLRRGPRPGPAWADSDSDALHRGAAFKKVAMKLSGGVRWSVGLVFERAIKDGVRRFDFRPHYEVALRHPAHARPDSDGRPYDAFRGFRSQHIHLSITVQAPVDRDPSLSSRFMAESLSPKISPPSQLPRSYNTIHLTPRFFTHFFSWWQLFGSPLSLPIRQGRLFPGREKNSKKFGRHLATIKYNVQLAPLFLSHLYRHRDVPDRAGSVSATGIKVRFDSFMLDLHQRREEFSTRDRAGKTQARTSGIKIHAAQLDLASADLRAVSANLSSERLAGAGPRQREGQTPESWMTEEPASSGTGAGAGAGPDDATGRKRARGLTRFTIPDNDFSWIDMDDFVELDWAPSLDPNPDTQILPLAFAPRLTYSRQTDVDGVIDGDPDRISPFGNEPTHPCHLALDDDPRSVQADLIRDRLDELSRQMARAGEQPAPNNKKRQDEGEDVALRKSHRLVLDRKRAFLQHMLDQMTAAAAANKAAAAAASIPAAAEFESDFKNRFVVHNIQLKWNNTLRNTILRYMHQVGQRRGFIYYLSRPAVKFILDIVEEQGRAKSGGGGGGGGGAAAATAGTKTAAGGVTWQTSATPEQQQQQDMEDKIRQFLHDGGNPAMTANRTSTNTTLTNTTTLTNNTTTTTNASTTAAAAASSSPADEQFSSSIEDLFAGIGSEFAPQSNYHIRLIAPQIQLQSDRDLKHVVLVSARGMELKVLEVMDRDRLSDPVSGLVQRRFLLNMDSTQFFETQRGWFLAQLGSTYTAGGSRYGVPANSAWPPWVPMEVMFDFETEDDPFGFRRVVPRTSATLRYDNYNALRVQYDGGGSGGGTDTETGTDTDTATTLGGDSCHTDSLRVEFPQARAMCNSSQYYAMYVIVHDLLMYSEPLEKTRNERLEKIILASDFSDLSGAPEMLQRLQVRIRHLEAIRDRFNMYHRHSSHGRGHSRGRHGWRPDDGKKATTLDKEEAGVEDALDILERDLESCEDELFFMMKAITATAASQRRYVTATAAAARLRWNIRARDIVWHLIRDGRDPLIELQLADVEYDRTDRADGSHTNLIRVGKITGLNLLPDALYPEMIAPYAGGSGGGGGGGGDQQDMIRVYWNMLEAIAGITVMDHFEVNLFPMKIQLEHEVGQQLFGYIFPGAQGEGSDGSDGKPDSGESPMVVGQQQQRQPPRDSAEGSGVSNDGNSDGNHGYSSSADCAANDDDESARMAAVTTALDADGSLEARLHPTLGSARAPANGKRPVRKSLAIRGEGSTFRIFRSSANNNNSSNKDNNPPRPSVESSAPTARHQQPVATTSANTSGQAGRVSRFVLRTKSSQPESEKRRQQEKESSDDLSKMMARASTYMTFAYIKMPSVELCLSYKGRRDSRNLEDVHDFVFRMPTIEWRNKTWSNLDLALALKKAVIKALISHTAAIFANKFSRHRPTTAQQNRLREIASSSSAIAAAAAAAAGSGGGSSGGGSGGGGSGGGGSGGGSGGGASRSLGAMLLSSTSSRQGGSHHRHLWHQTTDSAKAAASSDDSSNLQGPSPPVDGLLSPPPSIPSGMWPPLSHTTFQQQQQSLSPGQATQQPPSRLPRPASVISSGASIKSSRTGGSGTTSTSGSGSGRFLAMPSAVRSATVRPRSSGVDGNDETEPVISQSPPPPQPPPRPGTADPERKKRGFLSSWRDRMHGLHREGTVIGPLSSSTTTSSADVAKGSGSNGGSSDGSANGGSRDGGGPVSNGIEHGPNKEEEGSGSIQDMDKSGAASAELVVPIEGEEAAGRGGMGGLRHSNRLSWVGGRPRSRHGE